MDDEEEEGSKDALVEKMLQQGETTVIYPEAPEDEQQERTPERGVPDENGTPDAFSHLHTCPYCARGYKRYASLKDHIKFRHEKNEFTFSCSQCSYSFAYRTQLEKHMAQHKAGREQPRIVAQMTGGNRKFKCTECTKAFKYKHHLKEHLRIHSGEKPYECPNCKKRFSHSGSYSSHISSKKCVGMIPPNGVPRVTIKPAPPPSQTPGQAVAPPARILLKEKTDGKPLQEQLPLNQIKSEPQDYEYKPLVVAPVPALATGTNGGFNGGVASLQATALPQGMVQTLVLPTMGLMSPISINLSDLQNVLKVAMDGNVLRQVLGTANGVVTSKGGVVGQAQQQVISAISLPGFVDQDGNTKIIINYSLEPSPAQPALQLLKKVDPPTIVTSTQPASKPVAEKLPQDLSMVKTEPTSKVDAEKLPQDLSIVPGSKVEKLPQDLSIVKTEPGSKEDKLPQDLSIIPGSKEEKLPQDLSMAKAEPPASKAKAVKFPTDLSIIKTEPDSEAEQEMETEAEAEAEAGAEVEAEVEAQAEPETDQTVEAETPEKRQTTSTDTCLLCDDCPGGLDVLHTLQHCKPANGAADDPTAPLDPSIAALLSEGGVTPGQPPPTNLLSLLKAFFALNTEPKEEELAKISDSISLPVDAVKKWFEKMRSSQFTVGPRGPPAESHISEPGAETQVALEQSGEPEKQAASTQTQEDTPSEALNESSSSPAYLSGSAPSPLNLSSSGLVIVKTEEDSEGEAQAEPLDLSLPKQPRDESNSQTSPPPKAQEQPLNLTCLRKDQPQTQPQIQTQPQPQLQLQTQAPGNTIYVTTTTSQTANQPVNIINTSQLPTLVAITNQGAVPCLRAINTTTKRTILIPQLTYTYTTTAGGATGADAQNTVILNGCQQEEKQDTGSEGASTVEEQNDSDSAPPQKKMRRLQSGMYACDLCDKIFQKSSSLLRHKYEHTGKRPHECGICNKAFKHKHHLIEHTRLHSGEKPYQCDKCGKRFSHSGSYSQHMNHRYSYCKKEAQGGRGSGGLGGRRLAGGALEGSSPSPSPPLGQQTDSRPTSPPSQLDSDERESEEEEEEEEEEGDDEGMEAMSMDDIRVVQVGEDDYSEIYEGEEYEQPEDEEVVEEEGRREEEEVEVEEERKEEEEEEVEEGRRDEEVEVEEGRKEEEEEVEEGRREEEMEEGRREEEQMEEKSREEVQEEVDEGRKEEEMEEESREEEEQEEEVDEGRREEEVQEEEKEVEERRQEEEEEVQEEEVEKGRGEEEVQQEEKVVEGDRRAGEVKKEVEEGRREEEVCEEEVMEVQLGEAVEEEEGMPETETVVTQDAVETGDKEPHVDKKITGENGKTMEEVQMNGK